MISAAESRVYAQFESFLLQPLLQPFESAFGEYGTFAEEPFTEMLARELAR